VAVRVELCPVTVTETHPRRAGRETIAEKAVRLIAERRLAILLVGRGVVMARVRGDSGVTYHVGREPRRGWWCGCESRGDKCSHIAALRLVIDLDRIADRIAESEAR
jgi:hypothetical protein